MNSCNKDLQMTAERRSRAMNDSVFVTCGRGEVWRSQGRLNSVDDI